MRLLSYVCPSLKIERTGKIFPIEYGSERIFTASKQFRVLICLGTLRWGFAHHLRGRFLRGTGTNIMRPARASGREKSKVSLEQLLDRYRRPPF